MNVGTLGEKLFDILEKYYFSADFNKKHVKQPSTIVSQGRILLRVQTVKLNDFFANASNGFRLFIAHF